MCMITVNKGEKVSPEYMYWKHYTAAFLTNLMPRELRWKTL